MIGDTLARGGRSATFPPAKVSQQRWDEIWSESGKHFTDVDEIPYGTAPELIDPPTKKKNEPQGKNRKSS